MVAYWHQPPPFCVKLELSEGCNLYCRMAYAMRTAHVLYKKGFPEEAIRVLRGAAWCDWTVAGIEWMERRLAKSAVQRHAEHAR